MNTEYEMIIVIWYLLGIISYIYVETRYSDLTINNLIFPGLLVALCGPVLWLVALIIFSDFKINSTSWGDIVIKKKRN